MKSDKKIPISINSLGKSRKKSQERKHKKDRKPGVSSFPPLPSINGTNSEMSGGLMPPSANLPTYYLGPPRGDTAVMTPQSNRIAFSTPGGRILSSPGRLKHQLYASTSPYSIGAHSYSSSNIRAYDLQPNSNRVLGVNSVYHFQRNVDSGTYSYLPESRKTMNWADTQSREPDLLIDDRTLVRTLNEKFKAQIEMKFQKKISSSPYEKKILQKPKSIVPQRSPNLMAGFHRYPQFSSSSRTSTFTPPDKNEISSPITLKIPPPSVQTKIAEFPTPQEIEVRNDFPSIPFPTETLEISGGAERPSKKHVETLTSKKVEKAPDPPKVAKTPPPHIEPVSVLDKGRLDALLAMVMSQSEADPIDDRPQQETVESSDHLSSASEREEDLEEDLVAEKVVEEIYKNYAEAGGRDDLLEIVEENDTTGKQEIPESQEQEENEEEVLKMTDKIPDDEKQQEQRNPDSPPPFPDF